MRIDLQRELTASAPKKAFEASKLVDVAALPKEEAGERGPSRASRSLLDRAWSSEEPAFRVKISEAARALASPADALATDGRGRSGTGVSSVAPSDARVRAYGPVPGEAVDPPLSIDLFA